MLDLRLSRLERLLVDLIDRCGAIVQRFQSAGPDSPVTPENWAQLGGLSPTHEGVVALCGEVGLADGVNSFREIDASYSKLLDEIGFRKSVRNKGPKPIALLVDWEDVFPFPADTEEGRLAQDWAMETLLGLLEEIRRPASSMLELIRSHKSEIQNGEVVIRNGHESEAHGDNAQESSSTNKNLAMAGDDSVLFIEEDYRSIVWCDDPFTLTKSQALMMKVLVEAREKGHLAVPQARLLNAIDNINPPKSVRSYFFRKGKGYHPAWGRLIVKGSKDMFGLPEQIKRFEHVDIPGPIEAIQT